MTEQPLPPSYTPRPESVVDPPFHSVTIDCSLSVLAGAEGYHL
jgi:hypothetical protein